MTRVGVVVMADEDAVVAVVTALVLLPRTRSGAIRGNIPTGRKCQWVRDNGLDQVKPFDQRQERTAAMTLAKFSYPRWRYLG